VRAAENKDVVIIGGGAAGLFCAIEAAKRGRSVTVLEHAERVGKKIAISGGGRCNFTNRTSGPENFLSANPDFCRSALARYRPDDFIALVERCGIRYHEKTLGQLFCDGSSREIIDMLLAECAAGQVEIRTGCATRSVRHDTSFVVETGRGDLRADSLVIATGGLSIPKMGATDLGYRIARQFGLRIIEPRPGLVPLTFGDADRATFTPLAGVSFDSVVSSDGVRFREHSLFTHRGLSGPAILQISSYWSPGGSIEIDLLPGVDTEGFLQALREGRMQLGTLLGRHLPKRLAQTWSELQGAGKPVNQYGRRDHEEMLARLRAWTVTPAGTEGFAKAEVTCGGIDTRGLSSRTMESRHVPGLYFVGEVVDVTGHLGGHNFQWAWASGFAAGQAV